MSQTQQAAELAESWMPLFLFIPPISKITSLFPQASLQQKHAVAKQASSSPFFFFENFFSFPTPLDQLLALSAGFLPLGPRPSHQTKLPSLWGTITNG